MPKQSWKFTSLDWPRVMPHLKPGFPPGRTGIKNFINISFTQEKVHQVYGLPIEVKRPFLTSVNSLAIFTLIGRVGWEDIISLYLL